MKVLIVCSGNKGRISPFITEQVEAFHNPEVVFSFFLVEGKGLLGYLKNVNRLNKVIEKTAPDLIHAHYGLSGLLANIQRKIPVVTTFHGSDINFLLNRPLSVLASRLSAYCIFVSQQLASKGFANGNFSIIPCGIDLEVFVPLDKDESRKKMKLEKGVKLILFSGSYSETVKNYPLAKSAVRYLDDAKLIELDGYSREEVNLLMNSCDVVLMTSFSEGSPQIIKEAMACNRPVVSTDVGDVREITGDTEGCYLTSFDPADVALKLKQALVYGNPTKGRRKITHLDSRIIAARIVEVYKKVLRMKNENGKSGIDGNGFSH
jgi:teichuronic acid biosynthesis glycosyltransferase TuaC